MQVISNIETAEALEQGLRLIGFTEGAPPHISAAIVQADQRIYKVMRCGVCRGRGHKVSAFHRGREYRLVCECRHCGAGMEA